MIEDFQQYNIYFTEWMQMKGWSLSTLKTYKLFIRHLQNYLEKETSITSIREIDSAFLQTYQSRLCIQKTRYGKSLSLATQSNIICALKAFFQCLYEKGLLLYNPAAPLNFPKVPKKLPRGVMSEKQVELLLTIPDTTTSLGFRNRTIMEVLYSTGLRNSEVCGLELKDIDLDQMRITVRAPKNKKDRVLPLGEIAANYIKEYQTKVRPRLAERASVYGNIPDANRLFLSKSGIRITRGAVMGFFRDYRKKAKLPSNISPHSFRHSCATHMLKHGADIRYIQEMLGHNCIQSTQIYTRVEPIDLKIMHRKCHPREQFGESDNDT